MNELRNLLHDLHAKISYFDPRRETPMDKEVQVAAMVKVEEMLRQLHSNVNLLENFF